MKSKITKPHFLIFLLALNAFPIQLFACAIAMPPSAQAIQVDSEKAVIIWDEQSKTEHFIRSAQFSGAAKDFGFLVPTPTVPELAETSNDFDLFSPMTKPEDVYEDKFDGFDFTPLSLSFLFGKMNGETWVTSADESKSISAVTGAPASKVRVLSQKKIAGYDAAILEANNAAALNAWLKKHGYQSSPALAVWLEKYVKDNWKITAFKIAQDSDGEAIPMQLGAVRMSFKTEQPFYPYREPVNPAASEDKHPPNRLLQVWFLSQKKMNATIGTQSTVKWPASTYWSNTINAGQREEIANHFKLPIDQLPAQTWMTEFNDNSSPRPATDELFFAATADQISVKPPPNVHFNEWQFPLPIDLLLLLLIVPTGIFFWRRKNRAKFTPATLTMSKCLWIEENFSITPPPHQYFRCQ